MNYQNEDESDNLEVLAEETEKKDFDLFGGALDDIEEI